MNTKICYNLIIKIIIIHQIQNIFKILISFYNTTLHNTIINMLVNRYMICNNFFIAINIGKNANMRYYTKNSK